MTIALAAMSWKSGIVLVVKVVIKKFDDCKKNDVGRGLQMTIALAAMSWKSGIVLVVKVVIKKFDDCNGERSCAQEFWMDLC